MRHSRQITFFSFYYYLRQKLLEHQIHERKTGNRARHWLAKDFRIESSAKSDTPDYIHVGMRTFESVGSLLN